MNNQQLDNDNDSNHQYRSATLYMILICGIILIIAGVVLTVSNQIALGKATGTRHIPAGTKMIVTGPVSIGMGILLSIFPVYQLLKKASNK